MRRLVVALLVVLGTAAGEAHELRPAFLELRETRPGEFSVLWKTPMLGGARLALEPAFSGDATPVSPAITRTVPGAAIRTWAMRAPGLRGQTVQVDGLEGTMTDALVRVEFADGTTWTQRLTPSQPVARIPPGESRWAVARVYLGLGVEHIVTGVDHLLFVLALLIVARERRRLLAAVTAFTAAHSITLALAVLGVVHVPSRPVEAAIALSIVVLAVEIVRGRRGRVGLTARAPWTIAFAFGLLHGFGFAGALGEIGLPPAHIPLALLFFNVGVELGQLVFIGAVLGAVWLLRRSGTRSTGWAELVPPYAIGTVAMLWVFQRLAGF
jgi:hydrogenase/urease accessory protein HupE